MTESARPRRWSGSGRTPRICEARALWEARTQGDFMRDNGGISALLPTIIQALNDFLVGVRLA
jgi:hypothetical protein